MNVSGKFPYNEKIENLPLLALTESEYKRYILICVNYLYRMLLQFINKTLFIIFRDYIHTSIFSP